MRGFTITGSLKGEDWSVRVATSRFMQTNVTSLRSGAECLVVDAPYFPDELAALPALAGSGEVALFATHSHFDHLMARYAFPSAPLLVGTPTARVLAEDTERPKRELAEEDARTYVARERPLLFGALRAVPVPGWLDVGVLELELVDAPGHTADGTALWSETAGLLLCGDYCSDVEIPLLSAAGSLDGYRRTAERLAGLAERARLVVPGHGRPCDGAAALARLRADLAYLEELPRGDADQPLPEGRDTPRQREIHRANLERHGPRKPRSRARKTS